MQQLLEKHASGVMGRDLRRLYKEVTGNDLPLGEFARPIELVEKELTDTVYYTRELDGDVKYFLKKKSTEAGPRPLWQLTCHGDDNCQSVISGDTSFEELKLQAYWGIWRGRYQQIERTESDLIQQAKARVDAHQAAKTPRCRISLWPRLPPSLTQTPIPLATQAPMSSVATLVPMSLPIPLPIPVRTTPFQPSSSSNSSSKCRKPTSSSRAAMSQDKR